MIKKTLLSLFALSLIVVAVFTGAVVFASSANSVAFTGPSNSVYIHEEKLYDKFGIVDSSQTGNVELNPFESKLPLENKTSDIGTIKINYTAKVTDSCELRLKPKIPDIFCSEFEIIKSNVPITLDQATSDLTVVVDDSFVAGGSSIEIEAVIKLDSSGGGCIFGEHEQNLNKFLQADDEVFHYPIDSPEIQEIVRLLNKDKNTVELVDEIKNFVRAALKPSDEETNASVLESLKLGKGDCDDYARLFVTLARAMGIPARVQFNSKHMWAEVLIPADNGSYSMSDGSYKWIVVDPTDSYDDISYSLSLDIEPACENYEHGNYIIEDEVWRLE